MISEILLGTTWITVLRVHRIVRTRLTLTTTLFSAQVFAWYAERRERFESDTTDIDAYSNIFLDSP